MSTYTHYQKKKKKGKINLYIYFMIKINSLLLRESKFNYIILINNGTSSSKKN